MEWFCAYGFLSESGSVSNPTSQQSPDGLAANLLTRSGSNLGASWVGDEGDEVLQVNIASTAIRPSAAVFFFVGDVSDNATITVHRGTIASPGALVTTLEKCEPWNGWIGFSEVTADTSQWVLTIDDTGAGTISNPVTLSAQFFGIGERIILGGGGEGWDIARPGQVRQPNDLSTHSQGQLGADFAAEQVTQYALTLQVGSHEDTTAWARLRAAILACKTVRPVLMCCDKDRATEYGVTVLGRFVAMPGEPVDLGMMVGGSLQIVEVL